MAHHTEEQWAKLFCALHGKLIKQCLNVRTSNYLGFEAPFDTGLLQRVSGRPHRHFIAYFWHVPCNAFGNAGHH
ncbi:MAG: hypothetical protein ACI82I_000528 [Gammaproteobacteria bacterium]|jgi:hypothetical protein